VAAAAVVLIATPLSAACGSAGPTPSSGGPASRTAGVSPAPTPTPTPTPTPSPTRRPQPTPKPAPSSTSSERAAPRSPTKILVVIEENHTLAQMRSGMPYVASLAQRYGYATRWRALTHPSEPNYLAIAGGSTYGVTDDRAPSANAAKVGRAHSVFGQALSVGKTAKTYADAMPDACHVWDSPDRSVGKPTYAVRHNPWVYFTAERAQCRKYDVPVAALARDARRGTLPNVGLLVPDLTHDAHDGSLHAADAWLRTQLAPVLAGPDFTRGRLVVVITADEDDKSGNNTVLTAVLHPRLRHKVVRTPLTHYSLTRFIGQVLRVTPLGQGRTAPDMRAAFGL
jgi:acid phosphatase